MNVLITGGTEFIGSNFIFHILKEHLTYRIMFLDALIYARNLSTFEPTMVNPNFKFVEGGITDRKLVGNLFEEENFDFLVNFAVESHLERLVEDPWIFLKKYILGAKVLIDTSRKYGVKRYHQVSTDEVYGDLPLDRLNLFYTEDTSSNILLPYSASKASSDLIVQAYHLTFKLPISIFRLFNINGPYHSSEKMIPHRISRSLNDECVSSIRLKMVRW